MKKINLAITGCMGRMGQQLIKSTKKNTEFKIGSLTENKKILSEEVMTVYRQETLPHLNSVTNATVYLSVSNKNQSLQEPN